MGKVQKESKFLKVGDNISFRRNTEGIEYELEPSTVYNVEYDDYMDELTLIKSPGLQLPKKVYVSDDSCHFMNKVIKHFNNSKDGITGVMLSGLKGSGKTVMLKDIAIDSKLPIILLDQSLHPRILTKLFNQLSDVEVCIIMDEVDKFGKNYDDSYLLKVMDGINSSGKKLMLFTCNDDSAVSKYLLDRCSRIRYWKEFDEMDKDLIKAVIEDKLDDKKEAKPVFDFIQNSFGCISFDNICSFIDEVNENPNDTFEELFNDMNLSVK